jgi:hypothetical protein
VAGLEYGELKMLSDDCTKLLELQKRQLEAIRRENEFRDSFEHYAMEKCVKSFGKLAQLLEMDEEYKNSLNYIMSKNYFFQNDDSPSYKLGVMHVLNVLIHADEEFKYLNMKEKGKVYE